MKIGSLFDLINDVNDFLAYYEGVATTDQLVSRHERLKRIDPDDQLACLEGIRHSVAKLLGETLEMNASLDTSDDNDDSDPLLDKELAKLIGDNGDENSNTEATSTTEDPKNVVPPAE